MKRIIYHILLPAFMPAIFFRVAFTPVEVLGCRNRGLLALMIALLSGLVALSAAAIGIKRRLRSDGNALWWLLSALVLTIPVIAMIILA